MASRILYFPTIRELVKKITKFDKKTKVIINGESNDYPDVIERLHFQSITSIQCQGLMRKSITGKGFEGQNETVVNHIDGTTLFWFLNTFNDDYSLHNGAAVHVQYRVEIDNTTDSPITTIKKDRFKVIPFSHVRKGKEDDADYNGKFAVSSKWANGKPKAKDIVWYDAFNDNPDVVLSQIEKAGGINKYKGQLFFFNPSRYDYPFAWMNSVINDTDTEFRVGVFRNINLRKGVFGKKIFVLPPIVEPRLREGYYKNSLSGPDLDLYRHQSRMLSNIEDSLEGFIGVENNKGFMVLEAEFDGDDPEKMLRVINVETDINPELFKLTREEVFDNIRRAYNNVPQVLIANKDSGVFSDSAALVLAAKIQYQENTKEERMLIEQAFKKLFDGFEPINTTLLNIEPLIEIEQEDQEQEDQEQEDQEQEEDINAAAQATLRGSVGGVTALLQIQQSVAQQTTTPEAGIAMIREIYGFDEATAREML